MRQVLILANQTAAGAHIRHAVEQMLAVDPSAAFRLVVPATPADGDADQLASGRLAEALAALEGIPAPLTGSIGHAQPMQAVADAIEEERVDVVLLSTLPPGKSRWLRMDLPHRLQRKFGLRVDVVTPADLAEARLPASDVQTPVSAEKPVVAEKPAGAEVGILLVEDNPHDAELTKMALAQTSVPNRVRLASTGASALAYLTDVGIEKIDLIILDLKMPILDGLGFLEEIGKTLDLADTTVVILTTSTRDEDRVRAHELGAGAYMVKEPDFDVFQHTLEGIVMEVAG